MIGEQCEHGQLKRQCRLCEQAKEIADAVGLFTRIERYVGKAAPSGSMWADDGGLADQVEEWLNRNA